MARVTAALLRDFELRSPGCLFCGVEVRLGQSDSETLFGPDFIYWQHGNRLVLCSDCAETILPRLLADLVNPYVEKDADQVWARLELQFRSSLANQFREMWQDALSEEGWQETAVKKKAVKKVRRPKKRRSRR